MGKKVLEPKIDFEHKGKLVFQCYGVNYFSVEDDRFIYTIFFERYKDNGILKNKVYAYVNGVLKSTTYKNYESSVIETGYDVVNRLIMDYNLKEDDD